MSDYALYRFTQAGAFAIAVLGLNLLVGASGQLSIGHSAFFALGAYGVAILSGEGGLSVYLAFPLVGLGCFVAGCAFGWPALRLSGVHLLLATWALAVALPQLLHSSWLEPWTGGSMGIYIERPTPPAGMPLSEDQWWHLVTLVLLLILFPLARNLLNSRGGRALRAIRDHEDAARSCGINVARYKAIIFGISAGYAGIAGALFGVLTDFIAPNSYDVFFAMTLLACAVISGLGGIWTALLGGLLIEFLPDAASLVAGEVAFPAAAYGVLLIAMVYLMPQGLAGAFEKLLRRR